MTSIFTTDAEVRAKGGADFPAVGVFTDANLTAAGLQAESWINAQTRFNWSDAITAGLNADVKGILSECCACLVAIEGISFNLNAYPSRTSAETKINVLHNRAIECINLLNDINVKDFITKA